MYFSSIFVFDQNFQILNQNVPEFLLNQQFKHPLSSFVSFQTLKHKKNMMKNFHQMVAAKNQKESNSIMTIIPI